MKNFKTVNVGSRQHVVCEAEARGTYSTGEKIPEANYLGTGMALCGILDKGESLDNFIAKVKQKEAKRVMA